MAESQFSPGAPAGFVTESNQRGIEQGQSMMMRASQMRQQQQMEQLTQQHIAEQQLLMPVKVASAQADLATAASSIATNTRIQGFRKQAATSAPMANNEFLDALQLADWDAQSSELSRIQAKYSFMGQFPEYKGFLDAVDNARAQAVTRGLTDQKLEQAQEIARMATEGRITGAEIAAGARQTVAETNAGARTGAAEITAGARRDVAEAAHEGSAARTEYRGNMQTALEFDKEAVKLEEANKPDEADFARKKAMSYRTMAKKSLSAPAPGSAAPGQPFTVPNVTDKAAAPAAPKKLYQVGREGEPITFTGAVKNPEDVGNAIQQAVNDGVITAEEGKQTLIKLGWKPKG